MLNIEKSIVPLVEEQFPVLYREHGQMLIHFIEAYFHWMENHIQEIYVNSSEGFSIGDQITQNNTKGVIKAIDDNFWTVEVQDFGQFVQVDASNEVSPITNGTVETTVISQRNFNPLHWAKYLPEIRDVDRTLDQFILQFKNKYLPNIQFTTATNKQLFIKHALDFYRSKGTERALDLFFKLVYGFGASVYYPSDDIFKLSDNTWNSQEYIEVASSPWAHWFYDNTIIGNRSGARAYVDRVVKIKISKDRETDFRSDVHYITVLFISGVEGRFVTNEAIRVEDGSVTGQLRMIGSLSSIDITGSRGGYSIGDDLDVVSIYGKGGIARVSSTKNVVGGVEFELEDGGWGYSPEAVVIGSDRVLQTNKIEFNSTDWFNEWKVFPSKRKLSQTNIEFTVALDPDINIALDSTIFGKDIANNTIFESRIEAINRLEQTVIVTNDFIIEPPLLTDIVELEFTDIDLGQQTVPIANSESDIIKYDIDAVIVGHTRQLELVYEFTYIDQSPIATGDTIRQYAEIAGFKYKIAEGYVIETNEDYANERFSVLAEFYIGQPRTNLNLIASSGETYSFLYMDNVNVGVHQIDITPSNLDRSFTPGLITVHNDNDSIRTRATVSNVYGYLESAGKANFSITRFNNTYEATSLKESEKNVAIAELAPQNLNTADFFPAFAGANLSSNIADTLQLANTTLSSIESITITNESQGHFVDPFYAVHDPYGGDIERFDYYLRYDQGKNFQVGEIISDQSDITKFPTFKARIKHHDKNNRLIIATRLHVDSNDTGPIIDSDNYGYSSDIRTGDIIYGQISRESAEITFAKENRQGPKTGYNALIKSTAFTSQGVIDSVDVVDSGFGYNDKQAVELYARDGTNKRSLGIGYLGYHGKSIGYHLNEKSFISHNKYLHDNDYYQEYSYEVRTALPFSTYENTLKNVLHVAGTKPFGVYVATSKTRMTLNSKSVTYDPDDLSVLPPI